MKTFDELWQALCDKNPDLLDSESMWIKIPSFKTLLKQAWDKGYERGTLETRAVRRFEDIIGRGFGP